MVNRRPLRNRASFSNQRKSSRLAKNLARKSRSRRNRSANKRSKTARMTRRAVLAAINGSRRRRLVPQPNVFRDPSRAGDPLAVAIGKRVARAIIMPHVIENGVLVVLHQVHVILPVPIQFLAEQNRFAGIG